MRTLHAGILLLATIAAATPSLAKDKANPSPANDLRKTLQSMVQNNVPPGQNKQTVDRDQGDDHASARAIEVVCSKDTPAAQRSAICTPVSPF